MCSLLKQGGGFHVHPSYIQHTQTQVTDVLVPYRGISTEADQCFLSTNTRPTMIAQQATGISIVHVSVCLCVCVCVCVHEGVYLFPLPALYHPVTFQCHDLPVRFQTGLHLYLLSLLCLIQRSGHSIFLSFKNTTGS